jgi:hypothetical protein
MEKSILENEYVEPTRPYSKDELIDKRNNLYRSIRLADEFAEHSRCSHVYRVKQNSKKQNDILSNNDFIGNCSVCWKISKTPRALKQRAQDLIHYFGVAHFNGDLSYNSLDLETIYYKWLYLEQ